MAGLAMRRKLYGGATEIRTIQTARPIRITQISSQLHAKKYNCEKIG